MRLSQILNKDRIIACNLLMITVMVILRSTEYLTQGYDCFSEAVYSIYSHEQVFIPQITETSRSCVCGHVLEDAHRFIGGKRFSGTTE